MSYFRYPTPRVTSETHAAIAHYSPRYQWFFDHIRPEIEEFARTKQLPRAKELATATGQKLNARQYPMYFTGDLDAPLVLVHLNPKQKDDEAETWFPVKTFEEYFDVHRNWGARVYQSEERGFKSRFDRKQIRFLRPFGTIQFEADATGDAEFTNLQRVVDHKLQMELVPYGSDTFKSSAFGVPAVKEHFDRLMRVIASTERRYVLFCGAVFGPLIQGYVAGPAHRFNLRKKDGGTERATSEFANLSIPYDGKRIKAGWCRSWARQGLPMESYAREVVDRYDVAQRPRMSSWSREEVEATVADYFAMLDKDLRRVDYSKTSHRRTLLPLLQGRSEGAIERKHQNISAILIELGFVYISGYKPLGNYQQLLFDVVADRLAGAAPLHEIVGRQVVEPAPVPTVADILATWSDPPRPIERPKTYSAPQPRPRRGVDYLALEATNRSLGLSGEKFAVRFEKARLIHAGKDALADRVAHVSEHEGDGLGYDIRSFEVTGEDRLIEVKTTSYGASTPFFVTRNEVAVSRREGERYHLYRAYDFRSAPRLYSRTGPLDQAFQLDPTAYEARVVA